MARRTKSGVQTTGAVRQSITIPGPLVPELRRVAKERHLTISRAVISLTERGLRAEQEADQKLKSAYRKFRKKQSPAKKAQAGRELIRSIFGTDAIAED